MKPPRKCAWCGKELPHHASDRARYCSSTCRVAACKQRKRDRFHGSRSNANAIQPDPKPPLTDGEAASMVMELAMLAVGIRAASANASRELRPMLGRIADGTIEAIRKEGIDL